MFCCLDMTRVAPDIISGPGRIWPPDMRPDLTLRMPKTYIFKVLCLSRIITEITNIVLCSAVLPLLSIY